MDGTGDFWYNDPGNPGEPKEESPMTLAEKIVYYRKQRLWSQEDLAAQLNVSRQSVSKWESGASVPELDKIILLARIFEVTTDELLLDGTLEQPALQSAPEQERLRRVTLQEGRRYAELTQETAKKFALAVAACVFSPTPLILLGGLSEYRSSISEGFAGGVGVTVLLLIVAAAVAVFITGGMKLSKYEYIEKEPFLGDPDMVRWAETEKERLTPRFTRCIVAGVTLCILGVIPVVLTACIGVVEFYVLLSVDVLLWLVALATILFVYGGMTYGCYTQLLQQDDYTPERKRMDQKLGGAYWCVVTAAYLAVSFLTGRWDKTWIIWVCAGVLYGGVCAYVQWKSHQN